MFGATIDWTFAIGLLVGLILGTTVHEFGHAYSALLLGDPTAQRMGRVTLNPVAHFDPLGFILMVGLAFGFGGFAWGKPTPVNPGLLNGGRRGSSVVSLAGPFANIIVAAIVAIPLRFVDWSPALEQVHTVLGAIFTANILLFTFNLIPIPPLDGFGLVSGLVSDQWHKLMAPIYRYGIPILLIVAFLIPYIGRSLQIDLNILGRLTSPITEVLYRVMLGL